MNTGTENRRKTILAGSLGAFALCSFSYFLYSQFSSSTPPPPVAAVATQGGPAPNNTAATRELLSDGGSHAAAGGAQQKGPTGEGAVPGVAAERVATTSSSLDPTLDESAMLRTESLVYTGTGRNIFSAVYTPPAAVIPTKVPGVRTKPGPYVAPAPPPPPLPCPPSCPPIPLKFFGTATRGGLRQAFLLSGEDVYLASPGDIVARRYKVGTINGNSVSVEDLTNHFTQTLPLLVQ